MKYSESSHRYRSNSPSLVSRVTRDAVIGGGKTTSGNGQAWGAAKLRGQWRTGKMEETGCKIICGAPTTLAVKGLEMMMTKISDSSRSTQSRILTYFCPTVRTFNRCGFFFSFFFFHRDLNICIHDTTHTTSTFGRSVAAYFRFIEPSLRTLTGMKKPQPPVQQTSLPASLPARKFSFPVQSTSFSPGPLTL